MRHLLNTLYITNEESYLSLDGENVVVKVKNTEIGRVTLHNLESIVCMNYMGTSPALMGKCAEYNIMLSFLSPTGKFLAKVTGPAYGNILLRKEQYRIADQETRSIHFVKNMMVGKLFNSRSVINRAIRDHGMRLDEKKLSDISSDILEQLDEIRNADNIDSIRGFEGKAAQDYFSVMNDLILQQKDTFQFQGRSRRPPLDEINAMLSFAYSLLGNMCCGALETVGLDPYAGFMHTDRPGRFSLALDLMEELRPILADRFVLSLINKKVVNAKGFMKKENGAVIMNDETRKTFLSSWQSRKQETVTHPYLKEKIEWGLVPYVQALLLARVIRGDLEEYPPFMWK